MLSLSKDKMLLPFELMKWLQEKHPKFFYPFAVLLVTVMVVAATYGMPSFTNDTAVPTVELQTLKLQERILELELKLKDKELELVIARNHNIDLSETVKAVIYQSEKLRKSNLALTVEFIEYRKAMEDNVAQILKVNDQVIANNAALSKSVNLAHVKNMRLVKVNAKMQAERNQLSEILFN